MLLNENKIELSYTKGKARSLPSGLILVKKTVKFKKKHSSSKY